MKIADLGWHRGKQMPRPDRGFVRRIWRKYARPFGFAVGGRLLRQDAREMPPASLCAPSLPITAPTTNRTGSI